jgi:inactivated superfamily I helicase
MTVYVLSHELARRRALADVANAAPGSVVKVEPAKRSNDQNAAQWPILEAFSQQLQWPVNGAMTHMSADEWKDVLTAAFERETVRLAMGLDGGVVMLGLRTSRFSKSRFSEWLDFLNSIAAQRGVQLEITA